MDLTRVLHCTHDMALAPQWQRSTLCACTAVNDQLAKKMFGEAMRRQLMMDGQFGHLMCTLLLPCQLFVRFFCDCCCHELPAATRLLQWTMRHGSLTVQIRCLRFVATHTDILNKEEVSAP